MPERLARRVLLIGWDAADWKTITPLMDAGKMPALQSLVERGVMGNISTLQPAFSPLLWTSIATGHTADQHGILHFVQPTEDGTRAQPVLGSSRKVKALWNILSQEGLTSNVIGWWPSHPAEPIRGAMVSNFFQTVTAPITGTWQPPPGTVYPPELEEELLALRVHPSELTAHHLDPFIPGVQEVDLDADPRPVTAAKILASAASIQAAATFLMDTTDWDLTAVYFDSIDHFGHAFMRYHPPQMPGVSDEEFARYRHVVEAGYRFHDMMLGQLLQQAGEDTTVILLSDHGFHSDHLRPQVVPRHIPAGAAMEHRSFGVLCMAGPGIRKDERVNGAGLLNIAPTVLTLFGLPVGEDMRQGPLLQAFETPPEVERIPSWESRDGDDGSHESETVVDPWSEQEAVRQLVALGYLDEGEMGVGSAEAATRDAAFNLARVFHTTGRTEEAIPHYESVFARESKHRDYYGLALVGAYREAGRLGDAERVLDEVEALGDRFPTEVALLRADLLSDAGDVEGSLARLDDLPEHSHRSPEVLLRRSSLMLRLEQFEEAQHVFDSVLHLDPDNARAHHGLAICAIARKDYEPAAEHALAAVSRLYFFPEAHFHLGIAMLRMGWADRALTAFQVAVRQRPGFALAHRWLARIYQDYLRQSEHAHHHWGIYTRLRDAADGPKE